MPGQDRLSAKMLLVAAALVSSLFMPTVAAAILQKNEPAPPFTVTSTSGQKLSLAGLRGQVVVLDFFATWCVPCRESIPHITGLYRKYGKQGLRVVGMSADEGGDGEVKEFVRAKQIPYPVALADEDLQADYGLRSVPTIFVINKKGIVAEKFQGFNETIGRNMEALIRKLLAE